MKIIDFKYVEKEISFWLYFWSTAFPLAYDEAEDMTLADFIYEIFDCEAAREWSDEFVGFTEEIMEESDGISDDPTAVVIPTSAGEFIIQYHPGDTLYFRDGQQIASTGSHYDVHKLSFEEYLSICRECGFVSVLLLSIVFVNSSEIKQAAQLIYSFIDKIPLYEEYRDFITDMITEGLKV